jgi:hypothetical protein
VLTPSSAVISVAFVVLLPLALMGLLVVSGSAMLLIAVLVERKKRFLEFSDFSMMSQPSSPRGFWIFWDFWA